MHVSTAANGGMHAVVVERQTPAYTEKCEALTPTPSDELGLTARPAVVRFTGFFGNAISRKCTMLLIQATADRRGTGAGTSTAETVAKRNRRTAGTANPTRRIARW